MTVFFVQSPCLINGFDFCYKYLIYLILYEYCYISHFFKKTFDFHSKPKRIVKKIYNF